MKTQMESSLYDDIGITRLMSSKPYDYGKLMYNIGLMQSSLKTFIKITKDKHKYYNNKAMNNDDIMNTIHVIGNIIMDNYDSMKPVVIMKWAHLFYSIILDFNRDYSENDNSPMIKILDYNDDNIAIITGVCLMRCFIDCFSFDNDDLDKINSITMKYDSRSDFIKNDFNNKYDDMICKVFISMNDCMLKGYPFEYAKEHAGIILNGEMRSLLNYLIKADKNHKPDHHLMWY